MTTARALRWIETLGLRPHPEGGWFRETYRSAESAPAAGLPARFGGPRAFGTAIYFLLGADAFSALHRIRSDEIWHFYDGDPLEIVLLHPDGRREDQRVGPGSFQAVVPAGAWFGARVAVGGSCALVGCTVAPGFDFADFEMARRGDLLSQFPAHRDIILALTRE